MARQLITIHIGQAGVQIGNAFWELFCLEHGITTDGTERDFVKEDSWAQKTVGYLFYESQKTGKFVPRAVHIDLEPTVLDEIRTGPYRRFYHPTCLINAKEDASNNFARGFHTHGKNILKQVLDTIRLQANKCDSLTGFNLVQSFSGGTGAGLSSLLSEKLTDLYGKKFKFAFSIYPSARLASAIVDPYNTILHSHATMEHLDCEIMVDNETLFQKCMINLKVPSPSFTTINRIIAQMTSSVFQSHNYYALGSQRADTCQLLTNLIPYPRIHYPIVSYAPICSFDHCDHETFRCKEITESAFLMESQTLACNTATNKYISCAMMYKGQFAPIEVHEALSRVKNQREISFVDWCPTGFKIGLNLTPPMSIPGSEMSLGTKSLCMIAGNTAVKEVWTRTLSKYNLLYSKRSFVHWYVGEGMEEGEFAEANDNILTLQKDYEEIGLESADAGMEDANYYAASNPVKNTPKPPVASPQRADPIKRQSTKSSHKSMPGSRQESMQAYRQDSMPGSMGRAKQESMQGSMGMSKQESMPGSMGLSKQESMPGSMGLSKQESMPGSMGRSRQESLQESMKGSKQESIHESMRGSKQESMHGSMRESKQESMQGSMKRSKESMQGSMRGSMQGQDERNYGSGYNPAEETVIEEEEDEQNDDYLNFGKEAEEYLTGGLSSGSNRSNAENSKIIIPETGDMQTPESRTSLVNMFDKKVYVESQGETKIYNSNLDDKRKLQMINDPSIVGDRQESGMSRTRRTKQQTKHGYRKDSGVSILAASCCGSTSSSSKSKNEDVDNAITRLQSSTFTTQEAIDFLKGIATKQARNRHDTASSMNVNYGTNQSNKLGHHYVSVKNIPPLVNETPTTGSLSSIQQMNQSNRHQSFEEPLNRQPRRYKMQRTGMLSFSSLEAIECPVAYDGTTDVNKSLREFTHSSYTTVSHPYEDASCSTTPVSAGCNQSSSYEKHRNSRRIKKHYVSEKFIKIERNSSDTMDITKQTRQ